jgi:hypothetical protein
MDQKEQIKEQIKRSLNEKLLPFLASQSREGGGGPQSHSRLSGPELRDRIESVVSAEVDSFFSKMRKEDLFASSVSMALPSGPAAHLQKALIEESTRVLLEQIKEHTTTLRNKLDDLPDMMLNRRWILNTMESVFHDVVHRTPLKIDQDSISKVLGNFTHELLDHVEISHASLAGLKSSLTSEVVSAVSGYSEKTSSSSGRLKLPSGNGRTQAEQAEKSELLDKMLVEGLANDLSREFMAIVANQNVETSAFQEQPIAEPTGSYSSMSGEMPARLQPRSMAEAGCHTLVVHCIDPRFQENIQSFLDRDLGMSQSERAQLAIPGGVQAMTLKKYLPKFEWAMRKWLSFMDELNHFERIILIAHDDCFWYKEARFTAVKSRLMKATEEERQIEDLNLAAIMIGELIPRASIDLYRMKISELTSTVNFEGVSN